MTPRKIGILGGMGPEATVMLMQRIIAGTPASKDHHHIPMIVDNNPQVPSRIDALIHGTGESPGPVLGDMAKKLQNAGAEALIMPCNTAHHYANEIASASKIPFLNMVELTCKKLADMLAENRRVGILASPAVRNTKLFEASLAAHQLAPVYLQDDSELLHLIEKIKAGDTTTQTCTALNNAAIQLCEQGAGGIILACTEFSLLRDKMDVPVPILDTLDALSEAVVAFALSPD